VERFHSIAERAKASPGNSWKAPRKIEDVDLDTEYLGCGSVRVKQKLDKKR
jgi:hypothetical protein